jgi:hypothetical protein
MDWGAMDDDDDLDCGVEDAAEADGVLEEAVDVEHGGVGAGVGDVVDVRDHILAHPRCGASPPEDRPLPFAGADDGPGPPVWRSPNAPGQACSFRWRPFCFTFSFLFPFLRPSFFSRSVL